MPSASCGERVGVGDMVVVRTMRGWMRDVRTGVHVLSGATGELDLVVEGGGLVEGSRTIAVSRPSRVAPEVPGLLRGGLESVRGVRLRPA